MKRGGEGGGEFQGTRESNRRLGKPRFQKSHNARLVNVIRDCHREEKKKKKMRTVSSKLMKLRLRYVFLLFSK